MSWPIIRVPLQECKNQIKSFSPRLLLGEIFYLSFFLSRLNDWYLGEKSTITLKISIIVAKAKNRVIGKDNQLIWRLSSDLKLFKKLTTGHHIIMGRKTYESVGKPLPNRTSVVITRDKNFPIPEGHLLAHSLEEAVLLCIGKHLSQVFIIGGAEIYNQALPIADELIVTHVDAEPEGDVFFPEINPEIWQSIHSEHFEKDKNNQYSFDFVIYKRKDS